MKYSPKIIGLKVLREKMGEYAVKVAKGESFIVVKQSKPLFKIGPVTDEVFSDEFLQSLDRAERDVAVGRKAEKQERLFRFNPFYPSLHTEKLEPKGREVWSLRVDKSYRILFKFVNNKKVIFLTIGPHDWIYKRI
jgi:proteic killer suppression protein